jgi:hypothetical protein
MYSIKIIQKEILRPVKIHGEESEVDRTSLNMQIEHRSPFLSETSKINFAFVYFTSLSLHSLI